MRETRPSDYALRILKANGPMEQQRVWDEVPERLRALVRTHIDNHRARNRQR